MYSSDLTDAQWARLEPLLRLERGQRHAGGRPRKHELQRIDDGLSVASTAGQFSALEGRA